MGHRARIRRFVGRSAAIITAFATAVVLVGVTPQSAQAAVSPVKPRPANAVTADPLPTVQIDGIVWEQAINGNTVYVGGSFSNARPPGAAPGTNLTSRPNLLAYNITTGQLISSFNPAPNGQVNALAVSPDGARLYVGGHFTSIAGQTRYRIAAFNTATGALISSFAPVINSTVTAIVATNDTVYVSGWFGTVNGNQRTRLAAFQASNGALLTWAPTANKDITSLALTPDGSKVVIGGSFQTISDQPNIGIAAVSATTGAVQPWPVNQVVQNGAAQSGTFSLSTDNDTIYGTSYNFGDGNFEGQFAMNQDGSIKWLADCHGDTYDTFSVNNIVYGAGHQHFCSNIGGYPEFSPRIEKRLVALTKEATGTVLPNSQGGAGYGNFAGQPSPSLINYFPDFTAANVSGAWQAVWSLTGNSQYVSAGGEFPTAGGVAQQGLVRFAVPSIAPNNVGVKDRGGATNPTVSAVPGYGIRLNWKLNWDPDDMALEYRVVRQDRPNDPLKTVSYDSTWWQRPTVSFVDKTAQPGQTYNYRVYVSDPDGNGTQSDWVSATMASGSISDYSTAVLDDGATNYWPLNDASQSTLDDLAGGNAMTKQNGITSVSPGATGDGSAASFNGSARAGTQTSTAGPQVFTAETWIKTTTRRGGKILGFGNATGSNTSSSYDRHIYMDNAGHLTFGVYPGSTKTVTSSDSYNDGQWHHVVVTLSSAGMALWVDGIKRAEDTSTTSAQSYNGYWRLGGDNLGSWPQTGSSSNFSGQIDDTAIYSEALTPKQIRSHFTAAGGSIDIPDPPSDAYGQAVYDDNPTLYWRLDDESGPDIADAGTNLEPGVAAGGVTYRAASDVTDNGTGVTFNGSTGTIASQKQFTNPSNFSLELWFNTTTTDGGKLIGFGDTQSGTSSNYDRHVYMENSGELTFGTWTGAQNTTTSEQSYNDGEWHYLVATQGSGGMKLYVDGELVGTDDQTDAQAYTGYWRIGGDTVWSGNSNFFDGSIDEAAVYSSVLTQEEIDDHYAASPAAVINAAPEAAFTSSCDERDCSFDATGSQDPDGSIASYDWDFGDGGTSDVAQPEHAYDANGTYTVKLTVTDDQGETDTIEKDVTVSANAAPEAAFSVEVDTLSISVDASASDDSDGTVESYDWDFGDGETGTGQTASHTYDEAGDYEVTLTVTDDADATGTITKTVTVAEAPNQKPTAAFASTAVDLAVSFDAAESDDPDGTVESYAWDFGDGGSGTGETASHTYDEAGDYDVTLTVTDDDGATDEVTRTITVSAASGDPQVIAEDNFDRDTGRWGDADEGGAWSYPMGGSRFSTNGETGDVELAAGTAAIATLDDVSAADFNFSMDITTDKVINGGGANVGVIGRRIDNTYYSIKVRYLPNGVVHLVTARNVNNVETIIREVNVNGLTYQPGDVLHLDASMTGASPTTLAATVWKDGTSKPANPQISETDSTPILQTAGAVGIACYLSSAASNGPVTVSLDDLVVTSPDAP